MQNVVTVRLDDKTIEKLTQIANEAKTNRSAIIKKALDLFFNMRFTKNVSMLLKYFIDENGIGDFNLAINYLMLRALMLEIKTTKIDRVNALSVWDELLYFKKKIKEYRINKLAMDRIKKIEEDSKRQIEELSKYVKISKNF